MIFHDINIFYLRKNFFSKYNLLLILIIEFEMIREGIEIESTPDCPNRKFTLKKKLGEGA